MTEKIQGYKTGDVSDQLRAWTEDVANILNTLIVTADIANDAVTYAKIQNAAALSILGRAGNSIGDLADIVAASNDLLLRRTGDTINFGALTIGMVANSLLTYAKLQDAGALTVLGRASNTGGVLADIAAGANDRLFARTGDALAFVQLTLGMVPDALLTYAKINNAAAVSLLGRSANSSGVLADIAAGANDRLLARVADALAFVQLTIGMVPDALLTYAKINNASAVSLLGRSANSSGVLADIVASADDRLLARTGSALSFVQLTAGMVPSALITNAMRANMADSTISGRASGAGTGVPTDLTPSQLNTMLGLSSLSLLTGCVPANGSDATNDISFGAGFCFSGSLGYTVGAKVKQADAGWATGTNAGGMASVTGTPLTFSATTDYHSFTLLNPSTGATDYGFDTSVTAANLLTTAAVVSAGFTVAYRNSSFRTGASAAWPLFDASEIADGLLKVKLKTPAFELSKGWGGADNTAQTGTLALVPGGIKVEATLGAVFDDATATAGSALLITSLDQSDTAANSATNAFVGQICIASNAGGFSRGTSEIQVITSTARTFRYRAIGTTSDHAAGFCTISWKYSRL